MNRNLYIDIERNIYTKKLKEKQSKGWYIMAKKKKVRRKSKKKFKSAYIGGIIGATVGMVICVCLGTFVLGGVSISVKPKPSKDAMKTNVAEATPTETEETQETSQGLPPEIAAILAGSPAETEPETTEPEGFVIDPKKPMIALTFDDGPYLGSTEKIVDILEEYNAHATFFHVGNNIDEETAHIVKREAEIGCDVGNHSQAHENLAKITLNEALDSLHYTDNLIKQITGKSPIFVRPPYGAYNNEIREEDGRMFIYWSLDTSDWRSKNAEAVYDTVMTYVDDGDIILMHDIYDSTADAVEMFVPELIEQGYQLVSVSELMKYRDFSYEAGMVLFNLHLVDPLYDSLYGTDTYDNPPTTLPEEEGGVFYSSSNSAD